LFIKTSQTSAKSSFYLNLYSIKEISRCQQDFAYITTETGNYVVLFDWKKTTILDGTEMKYIFQ